MGNYVWEKDRNLDFNSCFHITNWGTEKEKYLNFKSKLVIYICIYLLLYNAYKSGK